VAFDYPQSPHHRRHAPAGYRNCQSYKPWLRDEFTFRCVYCLCRERWFPDGDAAFGVDHIQPQATAPELRAQYDNLVYACCQCNSIKGDSEAPNPCQHAFGEHLSVLDDGTARPRSSMGTELAEICRLNRPRLVAFRRGMIEVLGLLGRQQSAQARKLLQTYLRYPPSLPNLSELRPPRNDSPESATHSYHALRQRSELPETY